MQLTPELIEANLALLGRVQLTGNEVPTFVALSNALQTTLIQLREQQPPATAPKPQHSKAPQRR